MHLHKIYITSHRQVHTTGRLVIETHVHWPMIETHSLLDMSADLWLKHMVFYTCPLACDWNTQSSTHVRWPVIETHGLLHMSTGLWLKHTVFYTCPLTCDWNTWSSTHVRWPVIETHGLLHMSAGLWLKNTRSSTHVRWPVIETHGLLHISADLWLKHTVFYTCPRTCDWNTRSSTHVRWLWLKHTVFYICLLTCDWNTWSSIHVRWPVWPEVTLCRWQDVQFKIQSLLLISGLLTIVVWSPSTFNFLVGGSPVDLLPGSCFTLTAPPASTVKNDRACNSVSQTAPIRQKKAHLSPLRTLGMRR